MSRKSRQVPFMPNEDGQFRVVKTGRNAKCPCGSGKKSKHCCNQDSRYYIVNVKPKNTVETIELKNTEE